MNGTPNTAPALQASASASDDRREWACWAYQAPTLIDCTDQQVAEDLAARHPRLVVVSRMSGEQYPDPAPVHVATFDTGQRALLLAALLTDHQARDAALATLDADGIHTLADACDRAVTPIQQQALIDCLREEITEWVKAEAVDSTEPVTHARFDTTAYDGGYSYDSGDARLLHADGTVTRINIDNTGAAEVLTELSELQADIRWDSLLTVNLTTGEITYHNGKPDPFTV